MEGGQQAQVFEVLYVLHICALKDVVYLCDKPNDTYHCALLCLSNNVNQLYTSTKQHKHTLWYCILKMILAYDTVFMFYDHKICHQRLNVILSGFVIHFCPIIVH